MKDTLTAIHFEIIRNSIVTSRNIADTVGEAILRHSTDSDFAAVAIALMQQDRSEVFSLMKKILDDTLWCLAEEQSQDVLASDTDTHWQ